MHYISVNRIPKEFLILVWGGGDLWPKSIKGILAILLKVLHLRERERERKVFSILCLEYYALNYQTKIKMPKGNTYNEDSKLCRNYL